MHHAERREHIRHLVQRDGQVEIAALAVQFEVSEMTIRRDLEVLEREGALLQVRRGAISAMSRGHEPPVSHRNTTEARAKNAIGVAAAQSVNPGEIIVLDVGSTTLAMARALQQRDDITVVTASLPIAHLLATEGRPKVIVTGGTVRAYEHSMVGPHAESLFDQINCDAAYIGVAGVDAEGGLTDFALEDARLKQLAMRNARRCVVLASQEKLGAVTFAHVAKLCEMDLLITDAPPTHPTVAHLVEIGVAVEHADG